MERTALGMSRGGLAYTKETDMHPHRYIGLTALTIAAIMIALPGEARADPPISGQVCALGTAGVGQTATLICKDVLTGATTQSMVLSATVSSAGGIGGSLSRRGNTVLVANQAGGATLLRANGGRLGSRVALDTGGEGSLSGTLGDRGAYVLTGTRLLFFPTGRASFTSSRALLKADGSAAQVTLAGGNAYVSEKSGSLEYFALAGNGDIVGAATPVAGVPAGVIVGITGANDLVVAPVAHLASNFGQAAVSVAYGGTEVQLVQTKEVAACWTSSDDGEACVSNPGSMTVSCGRLGPGGFLSYTSAAANPVGDAVFDLDIRRGLVGVLSTSSGSPIMLVYSRSQDDSDFLAPVNQIPLGTAAATGALLLPALSR
jgi:hypothetical protein